MFGELSSHSSTLLYDIDMDGRDEIVYFTKSGEILFVKPNGSPLYNETLKIPPLSVTRDWYRGMDSSKMDFSMSLKNVKSPASRKPLSSKPLPVPIAVGPDGWFSEEAKASMNLISYTPEALLIESHSPLHSSSYIPPKGEKGRVLVDAHILSTPVIIDLDKDGHDELVIAVSYYFDKEHYSDANNLKNIDPDIDISKYVAGGLVVFDLTTKTIKWSSHLDLTTDSTSMKAYIYGSPTVVDIDSDGNLEVILGTGLGLIFVKDKKGNDKKGFPVEIGEIKGQVITEDINSDGDLELCAVDSSSNLVCFDHKGKELWSSKLSGSIDKAPMIGDINGDGILEIVVGTSNGQIWAVRSDNGQVLNKFPIKVAGEIHASPLLFSFAPNSLSIVLPVSDGYLYIIDGKTSCVDRIGIGEKSEGQVLADDISGTGKMDLVVTTTDGNVMLLGTNVPYHPMKAVTSQIGTVNGFASREYYHGIYTSLRSRRMRDVVGDNFIIEFVIVDHRKMPDHIPRRYDVVIRIGRRQILLTKTFDKPGFYVEKVKCPEERLFGTVHVEMKNEHQQVYVDSFTVSFNMTFLRTLKLTVVVPILLTFIYLLFMKPLDLGGELPE